MLISVPTVPAQPSQAIYPGDALNLLREFSRDSYIRAGGLPAPPFDPSRRVKAWFDTSVDTTFPDEAVTYMVFEKAAGGDWKQIEIAMSASEAATVNLPPDGAQTNPAIQAALKRVWPVPCRAMLPNETIFKNPFGLEIQRTDVPQPSAGGGFTDHDRNVLNAIAKGLGVDVTTLP